MKPQIEMEITDIVDSAWTEYRATNRLNEQTMVKLKQAYRSQPNCKESLYLLEIESKLKISQLIEAYECFLIGIKMTNLPMRLLEKWEDIVGQLMVHIDFLYDQKPLSSEYDQTYRILKREGYLSFSDQANHLNVLIQKRDWQQAHHLARTLIFLFPKLMRGYRGPLKSLTVKVKDNVISDYLVQNFETLTRPIKNRKLTPREHMRQFKKYQEISSGLRNDEPFAKFEKEIETMVGPWSSTEPMWADLKEFYFWQGQIELGRGHFMTACEIFESIMTLDPIYFKGKAHQGIWISELIERILSPDRDTHFQIKSIYPLLQRLGDLDNTSSSLICKALTIHGEYAIAKEITNAWIELNPLSLHYVRRGVELSKLARDHQWHEELLEALGHQAQLRPYDMNLLSYLNKEVI